MTNKYSKALAFVANACCSKATQHISLLQELVSKAEPKEVKTDNYLFDCPTCSAPGLLNNREYQYCNDCGQLVYCPTPKDLESEADFNALVDELTTDSLRKKSIESEPSTEEKTKVACTSCDYKTYPDATVEDCSEVEKCPACNSKLEVTSEPVTEPEEQREEALELCEEENPALKEEHVAKESLSSYQIVHKDPVPVYLVCDCDIKDFDNAHLYLKAFIRQNSEKHLYKKLIVADLNTNGYIIVHAPTENLPDILGFIYKANECVMKRITVMPEEDTYKVEVQMSGHTVPFAKFKDEDGRLVAM